MQFIRCSGHTLLPLKDILMRKRFLLCAIICFGILNLQVFAEERNYVKTVKDQNGVPILKVSCEYIGKKPVGEFNFNVDWQNNSIDFYNIIFENLSDKPIEFVRIKSYHKFGNYIIDHKKSADGEIIAEKAPITKTYDLTKAPLYDGNILEPFDKKYRNNCFYYGGSKHDKNVWYEDWSIIYDQEEYTFTIYRVYIR